MALDEDEVLPLDMPGLRLRQQIKNVRWRHVAATLGEKRLID
jgi:hypothetical protein